MGQQALLSLAQQGDPSAIATLINYSAQKIGITATAIRKGSCLHMVLMSEQVPEQASCVRSIYDGLIQLKVTTIKTVKIYGRKSDQTLPAWTIVLDLERPYPNSQTVATATQSKQQIQYQSPASQALNSHHPTNTKSAANYKTATQVIEKPTPTKPSATPTPFNSPIQPQKNITPQSLKQPAPTKPPTTRPPAVSPPAQLQKTATPQALKQPAPTKPPTTRTSAVSTPVQPKKTTTPQSLKQPAPTKPPTTRPPVVSPPQKKPQKQKVTAKTGLLEKKSAPAKQSATPSATAKSQTPLKEQTRTKSATQVLKKPVSTQQEKTHTISIDTTQTQPLEHGSKKLPLLLLGGTGWIAIAAGSFMISYQLSNRVDPTSKQSDSNPASTSVATNSSAANTALKSPVLPTTATNITIKAVGDMVPATKYSRTRSVAKQANSIFKNVLPYLQGADILFGNFESTFTNYPLTSKDTSRPMVIAFRSPPSYAKFLKSTGFNILSIANNHSMDYSAEGFIDTAKNIEKAGMKYVGKKQQISYLDVKGVLVAFIGFSYLDTHNSMHDLVTAKALVEAAKKTAQIVVISVHGGAEGTNASHVRNQQEIFHGENRGNMILFSRRMIDFGADLILGHGPHVPRAVELYKDKLIAYSLGNFLGDGALSTQSSLAESLILEVQLNSQGDFVSGKIIPVYLDNRGIPQPDRQLRSIKRIRYLTKTDFPNTPLVINAKGQILKKQ